MRIAVFTSNQPRHVALIESLAGIADTVFAVQECTTVFPGRVDDFFRKSAVMRDYFERVMAAERLVFGGLRPLPENVRSLAMRMGDLSGVNPASLADVLDADMHVVFGASYIRGPLCDALVERGAINIHMGVSPYYRGSSTNFWALYDDRPQYVGATIHRLTAGLDSGPILFHALPPVAAWEPFELGMQAVRAAHTGLVEQLRRDEIDALPVVEQDHTRELRYTRNADFTDAVAAEYLDRLPTPARVEAALRSRNAEHFALPHNAARALPV